MICKYLVLKTHCSAEGICQVVFICLTYIKFIANKQNAHSAVCSESQKLCMSRNRIIIVAINVCLTKMYIMYNIGCIYL